MFAPNRAFACAIDRQKIAFLVVAFVFCKAGHCFKVTRERGFHFSASFRLFVCRYLKTSGLAMCCQHENM
uniref:Uncharacterized protein n=2 Tax=unclassified Caudoviricetes TaxID=2788787 RepID=A0A8S5UN83_9CAUD|nr:MAG TPA: hypothetical protein [Siphoviridae sp. ctsus30]DAF95838.1 MAG TPA: hypothetical protein [Siphoviridae sp. ctKGQ3]